MNEQERETLRAERQAQATSKAARLRARADRLDREAEAKMAEFNRCRQDWAWVTQPASPNSAFGKQRQRISDRYFKGAEMMQEARKLRQRADELERSGGRIKGDAERERAARRAEQDQRIQVGVRVRDAFFGPGEVVRVNTKSYTVAFDSGSRYAVDKAHVVIIDAKKGGSR